MPDEIEERRQRQLAAMTGGKKAPEAVSAATLDNLVQALGRRLGAVNDRLDAIEAALDLPPADQPDHLDAKAASAIERN